MLILMLPLRIRSLIMLLLCVCPRFLQKLLKPLPALLLELLWLLPLLALKLLVMLPIRTIRLLPRLLIPMLVLVITVLPWTSSVMLLTLGRVLLMLLLVEEMLVFGSKRIVRDSLTGFLRKRLRGLATSLEKQFCHVFVEFDILSIEFKGKRLDSRSVVSRILAFLQASAKRAAVLFTE